MRLIDADALVKAFNEAQVEFDEYYKGLGRAKVIVDNAPTVDAVVNTIEVRPQGEWIAVKDKLPDTDGEYLVSLDNGRIVTADGRGIIENHDFAPKMLAWRPLPEPYCATGGDPA